MKFHPTERGFYRYTFDDANMQACSLQKSSLAYVDAIWLGPNDADPKIMASQAGRFGVNTAQTTGWIPYPVPDEVMMTTRMHLTREQVAELLPMLQHFVDTGELPEGGAT